jgi:hypothetical protein
MWLAALGVVLGVPGCLLVRLAYLFAFRNSDRTVSFEESVVDTELETLATVSDIDNDIYDRLAHHWWDPTKAFSAGLHAMTRLRAPVFLL